MTGGGGLYRSDRDVWRLWCFVLLTNPNNNNWNGRCGFTRTVRAVNIGALDTDAPTVQYGVVNVKRDVVPGFWWKVHVDSALNPSPENQKQIAFARAYLPLLVRRLPVSVGGSGFSSPPPMDTRLSTTQSSTLSILPALPGSSLEKLEKNKTPDHTVNVGRNT